VIERVLPKELRAATTKRKEARINQYWGLAKAGRWAVRRPLIDDRRGTKLRQACPFDDVLNGSASSRGSTGSNSYRFANQNYSACSRSSHPLPPPPVASVEGSLTWNRRFRVRLWTDSRISTSFRHRRKVELGNGNGNDGLASMRTLVSGCART
jgi:hypothetical protein